MLRTADTVGCLHVLLGVSQDLQLRPRCEALLDCGGGSVYLHRSVDTASGDISGIFFASRLGVAGASHCTQHLSTRSGQAKPISFQASASVFVRQSPCTNSEVRYRDAMTCEWQHLMRNA